MASEQIGSGGLDYLKLWAQQSIDDVLELQIAKISEVMIRVLQNPPLSGQNISEWAKQQACRSSALEADVPVAKGFEQWILTSDDERARKREQRAAGIIDRGFDSIKQVLARESKYWESLREFGRQKGILMLEDEKALMPACRIPTLIPSDKQASRLLKLVDRATEAGWVHG